MQTGAPIQDEPRAGARILDLLANPLHPRILRALGEGSLRLGELYEHTAWPAQTTLRVAIDTLCGVGMLERVEVRRMPYGIAIELTDAGHETLFVVDVVERWLAGGPQGPIPIDSDAAKATIKALSSGWSSTMVRALASKPASLTELSRGISDMSYPSLERRLSRMRSTRQVEPSPAPGRGQPFEVTDWLRHAVAPLCAAGRCERRHMRKESAPITAVEIEAAFLLVLPIAPLPESASGTCLLSMPIDGGADAGESALAGVTVAVESGRVVRCAPELEPDIPTWALGSPSAWLDAAIEGRLENLRFGGTSPQFAADLVHGIHVALF